MIDASTRAALDAQYGGLPGLVERLLLRTLDALREHPHALLDAVARGDAQGLAQLAHTINGLSANLLLHALRAQAEATELAALSDWPRACELASRLSEQLTQLCAELTQLTEAGRTP